MSTGSEDQGSFYQPQSAASSSLRQPQGPAALQDRRCPSFAKSLFFYICIHLLGTFFFRKKKNTNKINMIIITSSFKCVSSCWPFYMTHYYSKYVFWWGRRKVQSSGSCRVAKGSLIWGNLLDLSIESDWSSHMPDAAIGQNYSSQRRDHRRVHHTDGTCTALSAGSFFGFTVLSMSLSMP